MILQIKLKKWGNSPFFIYLYGMERGDFIMENKNIYVLLGASATGKTTLGRFLQDKGIEELVSHTTREMREGEEDGKTYYYINKKEFNDIEKVEWTFYDGNNYCLSVKEIEGKLEENDDVFVIMDREGIEMLKESRYEDIIKVIYIECNFLTVVKRLLERDGVIKGIRRLIHAIRTGEFNNEDIADKVIYNEDLRGAKINLMRYIKDF